MSSALALDTSAAVPFLLRTHPQHEDVVEAVGDRELHLTGHSLAETYAVLTRLPGAASPEDVARVIEAHFAPAYLLPARVARTLPARLAGARLAGGATYDALVGLAAVAAGAPLGTRDGRAAPTYRALGVSVEIIG